MPDTLATPRAASSDRRLTGAALVSVGMAVPEQVVTNEEVGERLGITAEWIAGRTGIRERRQAGPDEDLMELAATASNRALAGAGLEPGDIDLILFATTTHTMIMPGAGPMLAKRLGAGTPSSMDIGAACNGFISALDLAASQVECGRATNVLVVGADLMRTIVDENDRDTAIVFGDGAGASVVTAVPGPGRISSFARGADGGLGHLITASHLDRRIEMMGHETFRMAVDCLSEITTQAVASAGLTLEDIDLFVYHQANSRILRSVGDRIGLDEGRVIDCIERYGNTSAATVPIALAEAQAAGRLKEGDRVLVSAFGGGMTWGAAVVEWGRGEPPEGRG